MSDELSQKQRDFVTRFLRADLGEAGVSSGIVEKRKFLVTRWQQIKLEFDAELSSLCTAIGTHVPFEKPREIEIGVKEAIKPFLDEMRAEIQDAVDLSVNTGDHDYSAVRLAVSTCRHNLRGNRLIAALRDNAMVPGHGFENLISNALSEIEERLTA